MTDQTAAPAVEPTKQVGTFEAPTPSMKLSAKTIIGSVKKALKDAGAQHDREAFEHNGETIPATTAEYVELLKVTGQCTSIRTGAGTYGEWVAYIGEFHAVNMVTGEVFKGRELLLTPEANLVMHAPIAAALKEGAVVEVGVALEAKFTNTPVGYQYRARPLMNLEQPESRSAQMLKQLMGGQLRLGGATSKAIASGDVVDAVVKETPAKETVPADQPAADAPATPAKGNRSRAAA